MVANLLHHKDNFCWSFYIDGAGLEDLYTAEKFDDLKPLFGAMFAEFIESHTHWGWIELSSFYGDMSPLLKDLEQFDVVTYPDGVCDRCYDLACRLV